MGNHSLLVGSGFAATRVAGTSPCSVSGFGVGLSWAGCIADLTNVLEPVEK